MNEDIDYALKNLEHTHDVICNMEEAVLRGFDTAVRKAVPKWYGNDWECDTKNYLYDDYEINMYRKDLKRGENSEAKIYIRLLSNQGYYGIWRFLGTCNRYNESDEGFCVQCYSPKKFIKDVGNKIVTAAKMDNLTSAGFKPRGKKYQYLEMNDSLSFQPDAILQCLKDDDWEEALAPLKAAWDPLVENIDWDALATMLK